MGTPSDGAPRVILGDTTVLGRHIPEYGEDFFGGIPFAEAPVGDLRLAPPVLKTTLGAATFDASQFGPVPVQPIIPLDESSEDCLTINIIRPTGVREDAALPVMVWVYGGGYIVGGSSFPNYDGGPLVHESITRGTPIIYVSFNYRVGPLGFPKGQEAANKGALNLGLKDQVTALQWVQARIGAFGGDKTKVTIFGLSAGAAAIAIHMLRPEFSQLARAAIIQAGAAATLVANHAATGQDDWDAFVGALPSDGSVHGDSFSRVRSANISSIHSAMKLFYMSETIPRFPWTPTLDGDIYRDLPSTILASGNFCKIPFIAGAALDEGTSFTPGEIDEAAMDKWLATHFLPPLTYEVNLEETISELKKLYPNDPESGCPFGTGKETFGLDPTYKRFAAIFNDMAFESPRRQLTQQASSHGVPVYAYLFTDPQPDELPSNGVTHGVELAYMFARATGDKRELARVTSNYWLSFATSLTPNDGLGVARPTWSKYTKDNEAVLQFHQSNTTMIPDDYRKEQIQFINDNSVAFHH